MITKICEYCGKEFKVTEYDKTRKYCGFKCYSELRKINSYTTHIKVCNYSNKEWFKIQ